MNSRLLPTLAGYWDGAFRPLATLPTFDVVDPATTSTLASLPTYSTDHASLAVDAAAGALAQPPSLEQRGKWLLAVERALLDNLTELAQIITAENGKPIAESQGEVRYSAGFFADAANQLTHLDSRDLPITAKGHRWRLHHRPAGVAGLITPWNFPMGMLAKKLSGAIAAGCPTVIKPSELTPLSCIAWFTLLHDLDLPKGFVNLVFGDAPAIGQVLCERMEVRVISFTGSTGVGRLLATQSAPNLKRMSLELGGNAPYVVFDDADLDHAVGHLMANKFRNAGQTCVCANRILVQDAAYDAFIRRASDRVRALVVGPGADLNTDVGPLIDERARIKVASMVTDAVAHGAVIAVGGNSAPGEGAFFEPTLLTGVTASMRCSQEELFGPVVAIERFVDEEAGILRANDTEYGLAAYVFSTDVDRLERVAARLHFGHVGLNTGTGPTPEVPFGGMQQSGLGREGGLEGILEYIELQTCPTPAIP
ncbi:MAG: succinate-semialdehyde dehydrogenase/glutarate-semialdehyde dehydrogenase [Myxococcota bacterium]|jgi:succinate-semialdehyde dehydrogenase/glutarate-semialdehyde dehydrogenase